MFTSLQPICKSPEDEQMIRSYLPSKNYNEILSPKRLNKILNLEATDHKVKLGTLHEWVINLRAVKTNEQMIKFNIKGISFRGIRYTLN